MRFVVFRTVGRLDINVHSYAWGLGFYWDSMTVGGFLGPIELVYNRKNGWQ